MANPFDITGDWDAMRRLRDEAQHDASRITAWLSVGGMLEDDDKVAWLRDQGVTHVVSAAWDLDDGALCAAHGLGFYHVRWRDDGTLKPTQDFLDLLAWVRAEEDALAAQSRRAHFYLHCIAGAFRSPLLATFLLAVHDGMDPGDAYALLCERRGCVSCFTEPRYREACLAAVRAARPER